MAPIWGLAPAYVGDQQTEGTPAGDGGGGTTDPGTAAGEPADPTQTPAAADPPEGDAAPGDGAEAAAAEHPDPTVKPKAKPAKGKDEPPAAAAPAKQGPDLTARLASLSRDNRETRRALKQAEDRATAAAQRVTDFEAILSLGKDEAKIPALLDKLGIPFEKVVNAYAGQPEQTAEQKRDAALAAIQKRLDDDATARQKDADDAKARDDAAKEASARTGYIDLAAQRIKASAEKAEICARLGEEAASDVFDLVLQAWNKAGKPTLMPGELEDAIDKAIEVQELKYEQRGKQLAKGLNGKPNGANGAANGSKDSDLPAGLTAGKLSDKDEDILNGLIDKSAPGAGSQRAKPRTINSSLGGSAPPKAPARGSMDPRDALREVLAGQR